VADEHSKTKGEPETEPPETRRVGPVRSKTPQGLGPPPVMPVRRKTPTSTLSLLNARIPSNLPPRPDDRLRVPDTLPGLQPASVTPPEPEAAAPARIDEREMNDRVALGDYTGALEIAEALLGRDPAHEGAQLCAENCRSILRQMYAARIGPLDRVPIVLVPREQLRWLSIDHKAGFVLSLVDGVSSVEMIIDVSGMPELETLRILAELTQQRIIALRG
jgi:hypothetical protein